MFLRGHSLPYTPYRTFEAHLLSHIMGPYITRLHLRTLCGSGIWIHFARPVDTQTPYNEYQYVP